MSTVIFFIFKNIRDKITENRQRDFIRVGCRRISMYSNNGVRYFYILRIHFVIAVFMYTTKHFVVFLCLTCQNVRNLLDISFRIS